MSLAPYWGISIELVRWETHTRPALGRPQGVINEQIGEYDIFIGIMWKRFGSPTGVAESGTEEEFRLAYGRWAESGNPNIMFYFSRQPLVATSAADAQQKGKVETFRSALKNVVLCWDYDSPEKFADIVRPHLTQTICKVMSSNPDWLPVNLSRLEMQKSQESIQHALGDLVNRFESISPLARAAGSAQIRTNIELQHDDPPPKPAVLVERVKLRRKVEDLLSKLHWVSLVGSSGMGKTQLARQVFENWSGPGKRWVKCRTAGEGSGRIIANRVLAWCLDLGADRSILGAFMAGHLTLAQVAERAFELAGPKSLLVLDNVPNLIGDVELLDELLVLAALVARGKDCILTTSQYHLSTRVKTALGSSFSELQVPPMDSDEIETLLRSAGAPQNRVDKRFSDFLLGITRGHPSLLAATVQWLASRSFLVSDEELDQLLRGEPLALAKREARQQVRALVPDEKTRDLLDRLSLLNSSFQMRTVSAVGAVQPPVEQAEERFHDLLGPWVQELPSSRFEISPLLLSIGKDYLGGDLQKRVHGTIARDYLEEGTIYANDAIYVCTHLFAAQDWATLAVTLFRFMQSIATADQSQYFDWTRYFFKPDTPWSAEVPVNLRILVRSAQVRQQLLQGKVDHRYEADLEQLIQETSETPLDMAAVAFAHLHAGVLRDDLPAESIATAAIRMARALQKTGKLFGDLTSEPPEAMFWSAVPKIRTIDDVRKLASLLRKMTLRERGVVLNNPRLPEMSLFFADACYSTEAEKTPENRDWPGALGVLDELASIGADSNAETLIVAATRARAIILADYLARLDEALETLTQVAPKALDSSRFILELTQARILLAHGRSGDAFEHFRSALAIPYEDGDAFLRFDALKHGMQAAGLTGHWQEARDWCIAAIRINRGRRGAERLEHAELMGELAWIFWQIACPAKACGAMYGAIRHLDLARDTDMPRVNEIRWKIGHVLGWLVSIASQGHPPSTTLAGDIYLEPFSGMVCRRIPALAEHKKPASMLLAQLTEFAKSTVRLGIARRASLQSEAVARRDGMELFAGMTAGQRSALEATLGNIASALAAALAGARAAAVLAGNTNTETLTRIGSLQEALGANFTPDIVRFQRDFIFWGVVWPALIRLVNEDTEADEAIRQINDVDACITACQSELAELSFWHGLLTFARMSFDSLGTRSSVLGCLHQKAQTENYRERLLLCVALCKVPDHQEIDVAGAQTVILQVCESKAVWVGVALFGLRRWILRYWRNVSEHRSFALSIPRILRNEVAQVSQDPNSSRGAARVLLAAQLATGANLDRTLIGFLRGLSEP